MVLYTYIQIYDVCIRTKMHVYKQFKCTYRCKNVRIHTKMHVYKHKKCLHANNINVCMQTLTVVCICAFSCLYSFF